MQRRRDARHSFDFAKGSRAERLGLAESAIEMKGIAAAQATIAKSSAGRRCG
jgi:hypothetical protein